MASLLSPRRREIDLELHATTPADPEVPPPPSAERGPRLGWVAAALVGALLCLGTSWLLAAGLTVLGWVTGEPGTLAGALAVGTRFWLAAHGSGVQLGAVPVTLVPWGLTALVALLLSRCAAFAARAGAPERCPRPSQVAGLLVAAYLVPVLVTAGLQGRPGLAPGHLAAVAVVLLTAAWAGAARALGVRPTRSWPAWLRPVPRAVLGAQLVLLAAGLAVLATGLLRHLDRVTALHESLAAGVTGTIVLVAAQLALLPNAVVWATSYALGGGFTLGHGSVVAPAGTDLGTLPGLPLLGALPAEGPGPAAALGWLAAGVLAGAVAAWLVVRARPAARFDETALVGGLAGLLGGLVSVAVAWATSGDLGALRLAGLGPLLLPLLVMSVTTLGLAGMLTGLLLGLTGRFRRRSGPEEEATTVLTRTAAAADEHSHDADEPTQVLPLR